MVRIIYMNSVLLSVLLLQIYIIGEPSGVYCGIVWQSKPLTEKDAYDHPDFHTRMMMEKTGKRKTQSSTSPTTLCYDANDKDHLRLWNNHAPGAVGDDSCKDIPFLQIFRPSPSAPRTNVGIIVVPGGGYDRLTNTNEQAPVAQYFADKLGITTFILYYRLVQKNGVYRYPVPMWDGQRALRYVRFNAVKFNISPNHLGIFGFSAGGHLASTITLHFDQNFDLPNEDALDKTDARLNFLGLGYPVISMNPQQYASHSSLKHLLHGYTGEKRKSLENFLSEQKHVHINTPPTFLFESIDDKRISSQNSILFVKALENAGIPHDAHIFKHGKHGAGLAKDLPEERTWPELFHKWLVKMKFIS